MLGGWPGRQAREARRGWQDPGPELHQEVLHWLQPSSEWRGLHHWSLHCGSRWPRSEASGRADGLHLHQATLPTQGMSTLFSNWARVILTRNRSTLELFANTIYYPRDLWIVFIFIIEHNFLKQNDQLWAGTEAWAEALAVHWTTLLTEFHVLYILSEHF